MSAPALPRPALLVLLLLLGSALALALPASATAHASLVSTDPADGATVQAVPGQLSFTFTADVVASGPGAVQVFAPDETRIDAGPPRGSGTTVVQRLERGGPPGTYGVAWRVASADGHVISGTTSFVVGAASPGDGATDASAAAAEQDASLRIAFPLLRFVELLGVLVVVGGGLFACIVAPGWRPRLLGLALASVLLAQGLGYLVDASLAQGGSLRDAVTLLTDPGALRAELDRPYGRSTAIRAAAALLALGPVVVLGRGGGHGIGSRIALAIPLLALAASLSTTGHAISEPPVALRMPLDMLHVIAAATWLGGLVQLRVLATEAATRGPQVRRFSTLAVACVVVVVVTGATNALLMIGASPAALLDDTYGRLVLAKLLLVLAVAPLAWNNRDLFVRGIARRPSDAAAMIRRYVRRELVVLVVLVALTAWLVTTPPPA